MAKLFLLPFVCCLVSASLLDSLEERILEKTMPKAASTQAPMVPQPKSFSMGQQTISLSSGFKFMPSSQSNTLTAAIARYMALIFTHSSASGLTDLPQLESVSISINSSDETLQLETDESYTLNVAASTREAAMGASISAKTVYGALRALETFSQLVLYNFSSGQYEIHGVPLNIMDEPRFQYRGLLLDTSRHFEPLSALRRVVDSMSYAKLNVLHWHIVDSQSFPMQSQSYPKLWNGAYSAQERYSTQDLKDVVEYARMRGIRVMVEFDMPGHAGSWCVGYPQICPAPDCTQPLNPANNYTFELIEGLFKEMTGGSKGMGIFTEDFFHLGGDEVNTACWQKSPEIMNWMKQNNFTTTDEVYMYFVEKAHGIASKFGRVPVNWEEVFNHFGSKLDKSSIIHVWLNHATAAKIVAAGYRCILSNSDVWYLDHLSVTWQKFYDNDPHMGITDPKQQQLLIGGEVCMWGETVDPSDVDQTIWPRAAAAAERLWSPANVTDHDMMESRLHAFRCLLDRRGIAAAPLDNKSARSAPPGPGGCYVQ